MSNNLLHKKSEFINTTLDKIEVGQSCVILDCNLPTELKTRLYEMGLVAHTKVTVVKAAPLGDPIEIAVRGYSLCLRKETARGFAVKLLFG